MLQLLQRCALALDHRVACPKSRCSLHALCLSAEAPIHPLYPSLQAIAISVAGGNAAAAAQVCYPNMPIPLPLHTGTIEPHLPPAAVLMQAIAQASASGGGSASATAQALASAFSLGGGIAKAVAQATAAAYATGGSVSLAVDTKC